MTRTTKIASLIAAFVDVLWRSIDRVALVARHVVFEARFARCHVLRQNVTLPTFPPSRGPSSSSTRPYGPGRSAVLRPSLLTFTCPAPQRRLS